MGNSELNKKIENTAQQLNKKLYVGNVFCSECFYSLKNENSKLIAEHDCLAVEMESFALFHIAEKLKKKASVVLTVSDSFISKKETTALEREKGLKDMIHLVLDSIS